MIETSEASEPVYPAATVVLVRDGAEGIEALLVQRNKALRHMGGMWVFPGGRVEPEDYALDGDPYRAAVTAAIRETREEAGVAVAPDQLVYLSHWTTPEGARRRFATWFFLAILDDDQEVIVDGGEIAHHAWMTPQRAFAQLADVADSFRLMPPTYVSLVDLADFSCCREARLHLHRRGALVYAPRMVFVEDGICFLYQGDAGYEDEDLEAAGARHRAYMINGQLQYVRQM